ncbi:MAG TPA: transcriptional regulator MntR [Symbiobacteriaceae bacterium]|nr:transcriptional regulator MntR [Symbiobacteriaceae bacterium]
MATPSMEDYLEKIYELIKGKGYARVSDIAVELNLQPSSVTKMVQKLADAGYINYERYRGLVLTPEGEALGEAMKDRHGMLEEFLRIIGVPEDTLRHDVEGIEHHVSPATVDALRDLTAFFREHPQYSEALKSYRQQKS